jgi:hypothetical protein
MRHRGRVTVGWGRTVGRLGVAVALLAATLAGAAPAQANIGYELGSTPSRSLVGVGHGIAVDQGNHRIYVAIVTANPSVGTPGEIDRFESNLSAAGTFKAGSSPYYTGVAVDQATHGFYAAQALLHTPFGNFGTPRMDVFSSSGTAGSPFSLSDNGTLPQIAVDSSGDVYYPNAATHSIQVFDSAGELQGEIGCGGCPGGAFGTPVSVALSSDDALYVADLSPDRVVKLTPSGGGYAFASLLQSGRGAAAVAVDSSDHDVFVGDYPSGGDYHIVAYDSGGQQYDDFGAGMLLDPEPPFGALIAEQIAVDDSTHKLYVSELSKFYIFERATIPPPTVDIAPASPVGQLTATLHASANAEGHAALECEFEYADDADFQSNGFAGASDLPCPLLPDGSDDTAIAVKASGLSPLTVYHYRVTVTTNAGTVSSDAETFETLAVSPSTVSTEPPTSVTQTGANLQGTVNPHGGTVSNCHFEYGPTASYGTSISCTGLPEAVSTGVAESRKVATLTASTAYHYRLVVTSNAGTVTGNDVEFTTASPPPPPPPETTPPPATSPPPAPTPPAGTPPPAPRPLHCRKGFQKKRVRGKLRCVKKKRHATRRSPKRAEGRR